jgi:hypothetical protein
MTDPKVSKEDNDKNYFGDWIGLILYLLLLGTFVAAYFIGAFQ